jgi:hypothetical protein
VASPRRYDFIPEAVVGVDLGTSTLAALGVAGSGALLVRPSGAEKAHDKERKAHLRRAQRAQERSRRANNPEAYGPDKHGRPGRGSLKRGVRLALSNTYRSRRRTIADEARKRTEAKTNSANRLARRIVSQCGANIITEDVSLRAWQKTWGRSLLRFAPGDFLSRLEREAIIAGGSVTKVPCSLGLTQTCHCGAVAKKALSQRTHRCVSCGSGYGPNGTPLAGVDRDVHSAYLAAFVRTVSAGTAPPRTVSAGTVPVTTAPRGATHDGDRTIKILDVSQAQTAWAGAEALLAATSTNPVPRGTGGQSRQSVGATGDKSPMAPTDGTGSQASASSQATSRVSHSADGDIDRPAAREAPASLSPLLAGIGRGMSG